MAKEWKFGLMELSIKGVILRGRSKGMGSLYGLIRVIMKANFWLIIFMVKECIFGMMGGSMKVNGNRIKCMGYYYYYLFFIFIYIK